MGKKKDAGAGGKGLRKATNRRQFLKVAGIGGLSAASLYLLGCAAETVTTTVTAPGTTTTVTGPGVTTTVTAPGTTTTVTTGPGTTLTTTAPGVTTTITAVATPGEITWDYEYDIVVIGFGASGCVAANRARDNGDSVLVVEQNWEVGGRAMASGGQIALGANDALQQAEGMLAVQGVPDSPEILFRDLVDWSAVSTGGDPTYRYNYREMARAHADNAVATRQYLMDNGVTFGALTGSHGQSGVSASRRARVEHECRNIEGLCNPPGRSGVGLIRPMEESARSKGIEFMLNRYLDKIHRETPTSGRVLGISARYDPTINPDTGARMESWYSAAGERGAVYSGNIEETAERVNIKANKAVILACNGAWGNRIFRRLWDTRFPEALTQTNAQFTGFGGQSSEGFLTAMDIGANVGGFLQAFEIGAILRKRNVIGTQHAYYQTSPEGPLFPFAEASGLNLGGSGWEHCIIVNQVGKRFYSERAGTYASEAQYPPGRNAMTANGDGTAESWIQWSWRNCSSEYIKSVYSKSSYNDAALMMNEGSQPPDFDAGPNWVIFDADSVVRGEWDINYPFFTYNGYSFSANTLAELAAQIIENPFSKVGMPAVNLEATVARWNSLVDAGEDTDFGNPGPLHKLETPPFYAAWHTHMLHDTVGGLRVNGKLQVIDRRENVIPSLYACGEITASNTQHGLGRCVPQGYIAGGNARQETAV